MSSPLSFRDRVTLDWFYRRRLASSDVSAERVGWISPENQKARFKALSGIGIPGGSRVLDVGCGLGCFYGYLRDAGWTGTYTGFDRMKDMVDEARKRYPGIRFECRNPFENLPEEAWDIAFLCGIFNHKVKDNRGWILQGVGATFQVVEEGLAFNLLTIDHPYPDDDFFYVNRDEAAGLAETLAPGRWRLAPSSIPGDVTIFLKK